MPLSLRHAVLSAAEMRQAEALAMGREGISSFTLMERAGKAVAQLILHEYPMQPILVLCGPGNNGGDGFIAAQALRAAGWPVRVACLASREALKGDAARAAQAWDGEVLRADTELEFKEKLYLDALFGLGLDRPITGEALALIDRMNEAKDRGGAQIVSIDIPSGMNADQLRQTWPYAQADMIITLYMKKVCHLFDSSINNRTLIPVDNFGMPTEILKDIHPKLFENHPEHWLTEWRWPKPEGHKYQRGHLWVCGGEEKTGAARLAARAGQRMGAGLVTIAVNPLSFAIYAAAMESIMVHKVGSRRDWRRVLADQRNNAFVLGPGMGISAQTRQRVRDALATKKPVVLDADALTAFAKKPGDLFDHLHENCVLTPHEGEFFRIFESLDKGADRIVAARRAAEASGAIILLKGPQSILARPDGVTVINTSQSPWLATAGTGDVLAGMIGGLLAQGMPAFEACMAATWLHGHIARSIGPGLIAEDLIAGIRDAIGEVTG